MFLYSDPSDDIRHHKGSPGAYEWWYFDALDPKSNVGVVAILYDGLLFSPDYHEAVTSGVKCLAEDHPGFSLSLYDGDTTVFYALSSYAKDMARFGDISDPVSIGANSVSLEQVGPEQAYILHVDETLPSGLQAHGSVRFSGLGALRSASLGNSESDHRWNLVQPSAKVFGNIQLSRNGRHIKEYRLDTLGYHDHNIGLRPLEKDFEEWYWGRLHIGKDTLVWYSMVNGGIVQPQTWLLREGVVDFANQVSMKPDGDLHKSIFGLERVKRWKVHLDGSDYFVQDDHVWDSGPFYQRYQVRLLDDAGLPVQNAIPGIAEYIKPTRITAKWVKPMIRIRHHLAGGKGNWIQRSALLSKLTW